ASWRDILEERLIGPLALIKALAPRITSSIVLFSGIIARKPSVELPLLSAAAAAVESAARSLALGLAPVRVHAVAPGMIDTPMLDALLQENKADICAAAASIFPARRVGTADDVAAAAIFLLTNPFVTGAVIEVDGGAKLI